MKDSRFCLNNVGNRHTRGLLEQVRTENGCEAYGMWQNMVVDVNRLS